MVKLYLSVLLFGLLHLVPALSVVKARAVGVLGKAYGPVYGFASLVTLGLALWTFRQSEATLLYVPPNWGRYANFALSLLGFICVGIFLFRGSWRIALGYPMAIGVVLWALGHLLANGDAKTTILFGGLAFFAILHVVLATRYAGVKSPDLRQDVRKGHNFLSVIAGIAIYGIMTQLHYAIAGVRLIHLS